MGGLRRVIERGLELRDDGVCEERVSEDCEAEREDEGEGDEVEGFRGAFGD